MVSVEARHSGRGYLISCKCPDMYHKARADSFNTERDAELVTLLSLRDGILTVTGVCMHVCMHTQESCWCHFQNFSPQNPVRPQQKDRLTKFKGQHWAGCHHFGKSGREWKEHYHHHAPLRHRRIYAQRMSSCTRNSRLCEANYKNRQIILSHREFISMTNNITSNANAIH